jgi:hypothetical protein
MGPGHGSRFPLLYQKEQLMKKDSKANPQRILGRRLAVELKREQLAWAAGGVATWTLTYPADGGGEDSGGGGGVAFTET